MWLALGCSFLVFSSFALFAQDQLAGASKHQQDQLATGQPTTTSTIPVTVHHAHAQPRKFIDGAAGRLEAPFESMAPKQAWPKHLFLVMFGLLVYGMGLGWVSRWSSGLAHRMHHGHGHTDPLST